MCSLPACTKAPPICWCSYLRLIAMHACSTHYIWWRHSGPCHIGSYRYTCTLPWLGLHPSQWGREGGREGRSREQPASHIHMVQSVSHIPLPKWSHNCHTVTHILGMCRCSSSHHSQQDTCTVQGHSSSSLKQEDKAGHAKICTLLIVATNNKAT